MVEISEAVRQAQQALSEKFGIATFDLSGKVSTIPQTRPLDVGINVGSGSTGLTSQALNEFLAKLSPQEATIPTVKVFSPQTGFTTQPVDSKLTEQEVILSDRNIMPSFATTLQQYTPYIILGGLTLLAITLLKN